MSRRRLLPVLLAASAAALFAGFAGGVGVGDPAGYQVTALGDFSAAGLAGLDSAPAIGGDGLTYGFAATSTALCASGNSAGALYSLDMTSGVVRVLHTFCPAVDGLSAPSTAPTFDAATGKLYFGEQFSGDSGNGGVYSATLDGTISPLYVFTNDYSKPRIVNSGVTLGADGLLYGTSGAGGDNDGGTVYSIDPVSDQLQVLYSFQERGSYVPMSAPVEVGGVLYGTSGSDDGGPDPTAEGANWDVLYSLTEGATPAYQYRGQLCGDEDADIPLTAGSDGNVYGSAPDCGVIYRVDATDRSTVADDSAAGPLTAAADGSLYGIRADGTLIAVTPAGSVTAIHSFSGSSGGALVALSDGTLVAASGTDNLWKVSGPGSSATTTDTTASATTSGSTTTGTGSVTVPSGSGNGSGNGNGAGGTGGGGSGSGSSGTPAASTGGASTAAPTIAALSPASGPSSGGTQVTITGSGFDGTSVATFGALAASTQQIVSSTEMIVVSPSDHRDHSVPVRVSSVHGLSQPATFAYTDAGAPTIDPSSTGGDDWNDPWHPAPDGTTTIAVFLTISGWNLSGATELDVSGCPAAKWRDDHGQLVASCHVDPDTADPSTLNGDFTVTVTTPAGISQPYVIHLGSLVDPTVTGAAPNSGPAGTLVEVYGAGFTSGTQVQFGGRGAATQYVSSTELIATAPSAPAATAQAGFGTVVPAANITVTDETSGGGLAPSFAWTEPPCDASKHFACAGQLQLDPAFSASASDDLAPVINSSAGASSPFRLAADGSVTSSGGVAGTTSSSTASATQLSVSTGATASTSRDSHYQANAVASLLGAATEPYAISGGAGTRYLSLTFVPSGSATSSSATVAAAAASAFAAAVLPDGTVEGGGMAAAGSGSVTQAGTAGHGGQVSYSETDVTSGTASIKSNPITVTFPAGADQNTILLYESIAAGASTRAGATHLGYASSASASASAAIDPILISDSPGVTLTPSVPAALAHKGPLITGVSSAYARAGGTLTITGTGLGTRTGRVSVGTWLGHQRPAVVRAWSARRVAIVLPRRLGAGQLWITVTTAAGAEPDRIPLTITSGAAAPAVVGSVAPAGGPAGTRVTLDGQRLGGTRVVLFGAARARILSRSATRLVVVAPAGSGNRTISVRSAAGASLPNQAATFATLAPVTRTLGSAGGVLSAAAAGISLDIPPGAVSGTCTVTLTPRAKPAPSRHRVAAGFAAAVTIGCGQLRTPALLHVRYAVAPGPVYGAPQFTDAHGRKVATKLNPAGLTATMELIGSTRALLYAAVGRPRR